MKASAIAATLFSVVLTASAGAQRQGVSLRGIIFDSLRGQPMRDASVSIAGRTQVMTTDAHGRFQFDSVEPGPHRIVAQHPVLDSIGLSGLSARASVAEGSNEVRLAVPSFATLWRRACGGKAPKDSGIVHGTIRDAARGTPVANAVVDLTWFELVLDGKHRVRERKWQIETHSNELGEYAACGVAPDLVFSLRAASNGRATGEIDLPALTTRVQRRDLLIGALPSDNIAEPMIVTGTVADATGRPIADARVSIDSFPEVRSRSDGTFLIPNVPTGTRQLNVLAVGALPTAVAVDITPGSVANVAVTVRMATSLPAVETRAERNLRVFKVEFEERRRLGFGYTRDSTDIVRYDQFLNVLRDVPSMNVQYRTPNLRLTVPDGVGGRCAPLVMIDGAGAEFGHLIDLQPREIAALEVYVRAAHIPARFAPVGVQPQCGMILVWTKYGMRNR